MRVAEGQAKVGDSGRTTQGTIVCSGLVSDTRTTRGEASVTFHKLRVGAVVPFGCAPSCGSGSVAGGDGGGGGEHGGELSNVGSSGSSSSSPHAASSSGSRTSSPHAAVVVGGGVKGCLFSLRTQMRNKCSGSVLNCHVGWNTGGSSTFEPRRRRRRPMNAGGGGGSACFLFSTSVMNPVPIFARRFITIDSVTPPQESLTPCTAASTKVSTVRSKEAETRTPCFARFIPCRVTGTGCP